MQQNHQSIILSKGESSMKVKKRNLTELIFQCAIAVIAVIPGYAIMQSWKYEESFVYHGVKGLERTEPLSLIGVTFGCGIGVIFGVLFLLALIAGIFFSVKQFLASGEKRNSQIVFVLSIVELDCYAANAIVCLTYTYDTEYWFEDVIPGVVFYLLTMLVIATTAIIILGYKKAKKLGIADEVKEKSNQTFGSAAEDMEKLKELLDKGIITQEDFEAKKKQILDI